MTKRPSTSVSARPAALTLETYKPHPTQLEFHRDASKKRLLLGAVGAGKTVAMVWDCGMNAIQWQGARFVVFRKTYPALHDTTQADFMREWPSELIVSQRRSEGREEIVVPGGTAILFRALDDWRKLGSQQFDAIYADEATEFEHTDYTTLLARLRGKVGPRRITLACNPPNTKHWLHEEFVKHRADDARVHHFSTYDNADNLPPGYIADLEKRPDWWKLSNLHGQWGFVPEGAPVYENFRLATHVADLRVSTHEQAQLIRGWDFGWHHPACAVAQLLPTGHVNLLHAEMGTQTDLEPFARHMQTVCERRFPGLPIEDYCDIAGKQEHGLGVTAVGILRALGIHPRFRYMELERTIKPVHDLISSLHLGRPVLMVDKTYARIAWEGFLGGYYYDENGKPAKDGFYEHIMDAIRYMLAPVIFRIMVPREYRGVVRPLRPRVAV